MQEENYMLFEDYLSGILSKSEKIAFEKRLTNDAAFLESFELYSKTSKFLKNSFNNPEKDVFTENLNTISRKYFQENHSQKKKTFPVWKLVIAACFCAVIGSYFFFFNAQPSFGDYNNYPSISFTTRGNSEKLSLEAAKAFNEKNYTKASDYFSELLKSDESNFEFQLYYAISLTELGRFDEADAIFGKITNVTSAYQNVTRWHAALSKLKQKEYSEVSRILKEIPQDAQEYPQAKKLLKKIK